MSITPEPFFIPTPGGPRFAIYRSPTEGPICGSVLFVHAWAEEMNKSRRMVAQQAQRLAEASYAVLQIDLHGCGDSEGDWANASWQGWIDDVLGGADWLNRRVPDAPFTLWGHRAGALLAAAAAHRMAIPCHLLFWQPPASGKPILQQFLRLKLAAELQSGGGRGVTEALRQALQSGQTVDIAGYSLPSQLALGLEQATLAAPPWPSRSTWIEISARADATLLPATEQQADRWRALGHEVTAAVVHGPAFWQTQEMEDAPTLWPATLDALRSMHAAAAAKPNHV